jgi:16S rRNA (uracil1498-N3)-methyltransferase
VLIVKAEKKLHIGWCIIDPKSIEKVLPSLNEMGVEQISFIFCDRSQKNFKIDYKRLKKIILNSSQQCGRSRLMTLASVSSLDEFLKLYPNSNILNFSKNSIDNIVSETIVIGCEGGFTNREIALFEADKTVGLQTPLILRSESAVSAVSSKILL